MELTVAGIVAFVTLILGEISKKFKWVNKENIPKQNLVIGVVSGFICWLTGLEPNIFAAIITCLIASYSAGGIYDGIQNQSKG